MKAEIKEKWVAALRSGDYIQGQGLLVTATGNAQLVHCCLGVLCELATQEGVCIKTIFSSVEGDIMFDGNDSMLPWRVSQWAGLDGTNPTVSGIETTDGNREVALAELNDGYSQRGIPRHSFEQIATLIEENF